jgi:hypothetical protein
LIIILFSQILGKVDIVGLKYNTKSSFLNALNLRENAPLQMQFFRNYLYNAYLNGFLDTFEFMGKFRNDTMIYI